MGHVYASRLMLPRFARPTAVAGASPVTSSASCSPPGVPLCWRSCLLVSTSRYCAAFTWPFLPTWMRYWAKCRSRARYRALPSGRAQLDRDRGGRPPGTGAASSGELPSPALTAAEPFAPERTGWRIFARAEIMGAFAAGRPSYRSGSAARWKATSHSPVVRLRKQIRTI